MTPYTPNIPKPQQTFSATQQLIADNFTVLNDVFSQDHINYTTTPAQGEKGDHKWATFNNIQVDPAPALTYPLSRLYPKTFGAAATYSELYYSSPSSTPATHITLVPTIKAIGYIQCTGAAGAQTLITTSTLNFNIASVAASAPVSGSSLFTVTFTTAMEYDTYYINVVGIDVATPVESISNALVGSFQFTAPNANTAYYQIWVF